MLKDLTVEQVELIESALENELELAQGVLEYHIERDQTMETLDEFMDVIDTQQGHIADVTALLTEVRTWKG